MESKYLAFRFSDEGQYTPLACSPSEVRAFPIDQSILKLSYSINHQPKGNWMKPPWMVYTGYFFLPMFPPLVQVTHAEGFVLFPGAVWKLGEILQEVGPKTTFLVGRPIFRCHVSFREGKTNPIVRMLNCGKIILLDSFKHLYKLEKTAQVLDVLELPSPWWRIDPKWKHPSWVSVTLTHGLKILNSWLVSKPP